MSKVITVQDYLIAKDPEKYKPMFEKQEEAKNAEGDEKRALLAEIQALQEENSKLKSENKKLKAKKKEE